MINEASGRYLRLRRILNSGTGRTLIVPLDHAVAAGVDPGIADSRKVVADAAAAGADAVLLRPGLIGALAETDSRRLGIILMLTGRMSHGVDHILLNTVEHGVRCGADGVCAELKVGSVGELNSARHVCQVAEGARIFGLPLMVISYAVPEYVKKAGLSAYVHACRIAEELGADIIKTKLPDDPEVIRACLAAVRTPIVLAGGPAGDSGGLHRYLNMGMKLGVAGAAIGRNIWAQGDPVAAACEIRAIIHGAGSHP